MKKIIIMGILLCSSVELWANPLKSSQFKTQVKQQYDALELKLAALHASVDRRDHPTVMIAKACDYSTGLKKLKQLAIQNQHLPEAKNELKFVMELDEGFNRSLTDLGTTYEKGCKIKPT